MSWPSPTFVSADCPPITRASDLRSPEAGKYLQATEWFEVLRNAVTSIISPSLYDAGLAVIQAIKCDARMEGMQSNVLHWSSVYSGFSLIVNRKMPSHRDPGACPPTYDLLASTSTHKSCSLDLPDIGASFPYCPGTLVGLCGKVLRQCSFMGWGGKDLLCALYERHYPQQVCPTPTLLVNHFRLPPRKSNLIH